MGVKKAICNRLAATVAENGDPVACGLFLGSLDVVRRIDGPLKEWYEAAEIPIAEAYVYDRRVAAERAEKAFAKLNEELLARLDRKHAERNLAAEAKEAKS